MTLRSRIAAATLVAAVAVGGAVAVGVTSGPSPSGCLPDPAAAIAATPVGGIWPGSGRCYNVPNGLVLHKPITVENATFVDNSTGPTKAAGQELGIHPIIEVRSADNVTIENVNVVGAATTSVYHAALVGQEGFSLKSATNTKLINDTASNTMGDCLFLFQDGPRSPVTSNLFVNGFTCNSPGRFGISISALYGATLNNVNLTGVLNKPSIDFESDVVGLGAGAVTFNNLTTGSGIFIRETLNGPVTCNNCTLKAVTAFNLNSSTLFPVTFNGGSVTIGGGRIIGVWTRNGVTVFNGTQFSREAGVKKPNGMWLAQLGASLAFNHCVLSLPWGSADATSHVSITP